MGGGQMGDVCGRGSRRRADRHESRSNRLPARLRSIAGAGGKAGARQRALARGRRRRVAPMGQPVNLRGRSAGGPERNGPKEKKDQEGPIEERRKKDQEERS